MIETSVENLTRLLDAPTELRAEYETFHQPPLRPDARLLASGTGPQLFRTKHGRLDVLKEAGGETYETLAADAVDSKQFGVLLRCASLPALLRMKRAANRPKDQAGIAKIEEAIKNRSEA